LMPTSQEKVSEAVAMVPPRMMVSKVMCCPARIARCRPVYRGEAGLGNSVLHGAVHARTSGRKSADACQDARRF
jgi:hypothetical protein